MKIVGIIPARYNSTRFPGKALSLIGNKPMIAHVCAAADACPALDEVFVATDSTEIREACEKYSVSVIMTKKTHLTPTSRIREAAETVKADLYMMIGGDEPLISPADIKKVADAAVSFYKQGLEGNLGAPPVINAMTAVTDSREIKDPSNIKMVYNREMDCLYISRNPIPYHRVNTSPPCMKFVSIGAYTRESLDFFVETAPGVLEQTEECDLLRFLEYHRQVHLIDIGSRTLSVDTPEDLERVIHLLTLKGVLS